MQEPHLYTSCWQSSHGLVLPLKVANPRCVCARARARVAQDAGGVVWHSPPALQGAAGQLLHHGAQAAQQRECTVLGWSVALLPWLLVPHTVWHDVNTPKVHRFAASLIELIGK